MTSISIITATYNAERTIEHCLACVASQTISVEHVLIDGGSTDSTMDMVRDRGKHLSRVVSEPDKGIYDAMNKGIALVSGDVVGLLNADDFYPSDQVLDTVRHQFDDPTIDACYGDLLYVDSEDHRKVVRTWKSGRYDERKFYWGWMPPHPTFFVKRSIYERLGAFNLALGSAADYELMLRFLLRNSVTPAYIPKVLVHMRVGGVSNSSILNRIAANRMDKAAWRTNGLSPYPWTFIAKPLRKLGQWLR